MEDHDFEGIAMNFQVVPADEQSNLTSPYSRLRIEGNLVDFLEGYSKAGGTLHLALGYGDLIASSLPSIIPVQTQP